VPAGPLGGQNVKLEGYRVRSPPPHVARANVGLATPFGQLAVDVIRPDTLLLPSAADTATTPSLDSLPTGVDPLRCYAARPTRGSSFPRRIRITVSDELASGPRVIELRQPRHLCVPVSVNGAAIEHADARLLCYTGVPTGKGEPRVPVYTRNGLGSDVLVTRGENQFCIPVRETP